MLGVFLFCLLPGNFAHAEISENQGLFHQQIKLFTGKANDSYLLLRQVDKAFLLPRDLGISALQINAGKVHVEVQNFGEGELPEDLYFRKGKQAATLMLWLNGKRWGGVTLAGLDPDRYLRYPGGKARYIFNVGIADNTEVVSKLSLPEFKDANTGNDERKLLYRKGKKILAPIRRLNP